MDHGWRIIRKPEDSNSNNESINDEKINLILQSIYDEKADIEYYENKIMECERRIDELEKELEQLENTNETNNNYQQ